MKLTALNTAKALLVLGFISTAHSQTFTQTIDLNSKADQMRVIAITILSEARGETELGMRRVGQVILNRASKARTSPASACLKPFQFSFWNHAPSRSQCLKLLSNPMADYALYLADDILDGKNVMENFTATHFHSGTPPAWTTSPKMRFLERFKGHSFYVEQG